MIFRRLETADAVEYRRLRLYGLRESPSAFGSSNEEESVFPLERFVQRLEQTDEKWTFGAFAGKKLVGVVTLIRDAQLKLRHKAAIYAMYVAPRWRRKGVGRALLMLAIETGRTLPGLRQVRLTVMSRNRPAQRLYRSLGFIAYGEEPQALCVDGVFLAETLMLLRLDTRQRSSRPKKGGS